MSSPLDTAPKVEHDLAGSRFMAHVAGQTCVADYHLAGTLMTMHHTYVPRPLEGHGIAAALVAEALAHARREGWRVQPTCSYVARYMQRHPETLDLLAR
ncbi:MAG: GNAT family N-acetyltransferase [Pseudomonadota bacterium]